MFPVAEAWRVLSLIGQTVAQYRVAAATSRRIPSYTTNMAAFLKASAHRSSVYKKQFPTGTWLEVKGLALPEFMIEIDLEAHKPNR